uniref:Ubiquitin-like protease family profile domain-containing protein n=1 Tax=Ditylenchus dipsaci TaxID=166011 RepID=A0A915EL44_9BILA
MLGLEVFMKYDGWNGDERIQDFVGLRREFVIAEQRIGAHWAGAKEPRRGKTYVDIDDRIKNTISRYHEIPKIHFLRSIAINFGGFRSIKCQIYAFDTLFYTQLVEKGLKLAQNWDKDVRIFDYDVILIPVHSGKVEDGHWTLMVAKPIKGRFLYLDSLHKDGDDQINYIK